MKRLVLLLAVTLAGLYFVLTGIGAGERRAELNRPEADAAAEIAETAKVIVQTVTGESADETAATGADADADATVPPAEIVETTVQTPVETQEFPGPPLRPSPEHGGATATVATVPAGSDEEINYVTGDSVNFRTGPSTNAAVIAALGKGAAVVILGKGDGDWVNIRDAAGQVGYISGKFLAAQPD